MVALIHIHNHIASAGISAINGHMYGMNSIIQAISDNIKISSIFTQNNLMINSHTKVNPNILMHSIS
jgi:hypothetical protein